MLVLTRAVGQEIVIDGHIRVTVLGIHGNKIRLGVAAPPEIRVDRAEIHLERCALGEVRELQEVH